jgi:hypothetical protein
MHKVDHRLLMVCWLALTITGSSARAQNKPLPQDAVPSAPPASQASPSSPPSTEAATRAAKPTIRFDEPSAVQPAREDARSAILADQGLAPAAATRAQTRPKQASDDIDRHGTETARAMTKKSHRGERYHLPIGHPSESTFGPAAPADHAIPSPIGKGPPVDEKGPGNFAAADQRPASPADDNAQKGERPYGSWPSGALPYPASPPPGLPTVGITVFAGAPPPPLGYYPNYPPTYSPYTTPYQYSWPPGPGLSR